jgi:hypothetical protein
MPSKLILGATNRGENYLHILWHSYKKTTHSSIGFFMFEVCLGFQQTSPNEISLTLDFQGIVHQQQEQHSTHQFLQQLSQ